ncbi:sigma-70 family RNA polymerase sigma factor [Amycolatopsis sp. SID8362]|uniref:sigma-70 family RNA polymerase sigma factor n=1 Tax=Amycolatopsis sp. SID8362 TaxID=2690346 RepID=UPI001EF3CC48|nr:sigma-70 family RNA polymerase sigma factor [Amycolatopsis sp. SID8362]
MRRDPALPTPLVRSGGNRRCGFETARGRDPVSRQQPIAHRCTFRGGALTEVADRPSGGKRSDSRSDGALADAVRGGDLAAYGELYTRHVGAARRVAGAIAATETERDDLIAEAFTRILRTLRAGGGPEQAFQPYLLTTIRNTMIQWHRRDSVLSLVPEVPDTAADGDDVTDVRLHGAVAAEAFASLPERWRTVLWRTEIEGESPAQVARSMELTPNGAAALAYRAREGLRQAYLDQHIVAARQRTCRAVGGQLAKWVRGGLTEYQARRVTAHLDWCADCRELAGRLRRLNEELSATVVPLVLGLPALVAPWVSTSGPAASSGGIMASASAAGTSALSWVAVVKAAVVGAAVVAVAAFSVPASAPPPVAGGAPSQPVQARPARIVPMPAEPPGESSPSAQPSGSASGGGVAGHAAKPKKNALNAPAPNRVKGNSQAKRGSGKKEIRGRSRRGAEIGKAVPRPQRRCGGSRFAMATTDLLVNLRWAVTSHSPRGGTSAQAMCTSAPSSTGVRAVEAR